ncbi:MAG TPA: right-handed parallel beta-helix repeat-containing protein [Vicinamibacteria bacterium]|nr:right-handed parallel beta-helix repeat-containing protein [Vicinamibacteria bacterium]
MSRSSSLAKLLGIALVLPVLVLVGEYLHRVARFRHAWGAEAPVAAAKDLLLEIVQRFPSPLDKARLESSGLPVYQLRLQSNDLTALRNLAAEVSAARVSTGILRDYVPAQFLLEDGRWLPIEVKLRGKTAGHYARQRPSLRLKFPRNHYFEGKRHINISNPSDKGVTKDLTTNWELARHGILTWDSRFVVLKINEKVVGLFQEIEEIGRPMLDRGGRSEGFIFDGNGQLAGAPGGFGWDKAESAIKRLLQCKEETSSPPDADPCNWTFLQTYTDTDRFAWAAAVTTLVGSTHAWSNNNLHVYYDPARGTFEPIPWDYLGYRIDPETTIEGETATNEARAFLRIPEFRRMRDERLWTLITERVEPMIAHANEAFARLDAAFRYDNHAIRSSRGHRIHEAFIEELESNAAYLSTLFRTAELGVVVRPTQNEGSVVVELENRGKAFVWVTGVVVARNGKRVVVPLPEHELVDGQWSGEPGRSRLAIREVLDVEIIGLAARNGVTGELLADDDVQIRSSEITVASLDREEMPDSAPVLPGNARREGRTIVLGPGVVHLDATWEVPQSYSVQVEPGTTIELEDGASLIVYGDLTAVGTAREPIAVRGAKSKSGWGALVVQGRRAERSTVRLEHVILEGGAGAENDRTHFTGALSVTDAVISLRESRFVDIAAIDGINFKYCDVEMRNNVFSNTAEDAVDLDFCTGVVVGNHVFGAGGDGLDFSGSDLDVEQNIIENCVDKGMSVGEKTVARIRDNQIDRCYTGIASKDGSDVTIEATRLTGLDVGVSIYRKKLTFGTPVARLSRVVMADVNTAILDSHEGDLTVADSTLYVVGDEPRSSRRGLSVVRVKQVPHSPASEAIHETSSVSGAP